MPTINTVGTSAMIARQLTPGLRSTLFSYDLPPPWPLGASSGCKRAISEVPTLLTGSHQAQKDF